MLSESFDRRRPGEWCIMKRPGAQVFLDCQGYPKVRAGPANLMHRHPGGTLPHKLMSPKDYKAMDRLANRPEVTHAAVLCPHRERTLTLMRETAGVVLLLHDTTELDYSGLSIPELGPIGSGYHRGYLCHNSLAVAFEEREVLGLVNQVLHARVPVPKNETIKAKRKRQSRESRLWTQAVQNIEVAPVDRLWIDIADRGADVFEFLAHEITAGRRFVVQGQRALLGNPGNLGRLALRAFS